MKREVDAQILNWVNKNWGKLLKSKDYISLEIVDSLGLSEGETQIKVHGSYLDTSEESSATDLVKWFIADHLGIRYYRDLGKIMKSLKKNGRDFLKELEYAKVDWADSEQTEWINSQIVYGPWIDPLHIDDTLKEHMMYYHPSYTQINLTHIEREEKKEGDKLLCRFVDTYYLGHEGESLKDKLELAGNNTEEFYLSGDDEGDELTMSLDFIVGVKEFLVYHGFQDQLALWEAEIADSKVLQEMIRKHPYLFLY